MAECLCLFQIYMLKLKCRGDCINPYTKEVNGGGLQN